MRKNFMLISLVLAIGFLVAVAIGTAGAEMDETITINKAQSKKAPVLFPHEEHKEKFDCQVCHHNATGDKKPESCFNCHGKNPDIPDPSAMSTKQNPFHITCIGCHKEKSQGPTKCAECHKE